MRLLVEKNEPLTAREVSQCVWNLDAKRARERLDALAASGVIVKREERHTVRYSVE